MKKLIAMCFTHNMKIEFIPQNAGTVLQICVTNLENGRFDSIIVTLAEFESKEEKIIKHFHAVMKELLSAKSHSLFDLWEKYKNK